MLRLATLLIVLSASVAWAGPCPPMLTAELYSDQPLDLQVFFDGKPAVALPIKLYAGDKPVYSATTDRNGDVRMDILPGKYKVVIPRKETLDLVVSPQKNHLNGPFFSWYLFPKTRYKWVAGKKVPGIPCPGLGLKED